MIALTLLLHLSSLLAFPVLAGPVPQEMPGDAFAIPAAPIALRAGPSANHAGVMMLDADDVARIAVAADASSSGYVRVYVPQGFPVYVHGDFVGVDIARQRVTVEGTRLNLRLLPATVGLVPIGQLDDGGHELQLLGVEGDWVRVLAPLTLPLYAKSDELPQVSSEVASARWSQRLGSRESQRRAKVAAFEATDPVRIRDRHLEEQVSQLNGVLLSDLTEAELKARESSLKTLAVESTRPDISSAVQRLQSEVVLERQRREAAVATLVEMERQRAREAANLVREARALDFGLRFLGKGETLTLEGLVTRRTSEDTDSAVYTIQGPAGRTFKLSAAKEIADLKTLIGKRVSLEGRSLSLVNVQGPVLIVDSIVRVSNP